MSNPNSHNPHDPLYSPDPNDPMGGTGSAGGGDPLDPLDPHASGDPAITPDPIPGGAPETLGRTRGRDLIPPPPLSMSGIPDELEIVAEPARTGSAKRAGLLMAAAVALIGGGVGLLLWQRGTPKPVQTSQRAPTATPVRPVETMPSPTAASPDAPASDTGAKDTQGIAGVTASQSARIQFMDRRDPNRVAGELKYSKLDPLERGQQLITEPRAWIYLRDGRTVHVQAAKGKLTTPTSGDKPQEPESGTFEGAVVIRMYSAGVDGQPRPIDTDVDQPTMMFRTDAFTFNTVLSEVTTASTWQASAPSWDYAARGMRLVYDEVSQRIELFETDGDNKVRYFGGGGSTGAIGGPTSKPTTTAAGDPAPAPGGTPAGDTPASLDPTAPTVQAKTPEEVLYRAELAGPVKLAGETQTLEAPGGMVWVRLIDGALREGAIAPVKFAEEPAPTAVAASDAAAPVESDPSESNATPVADASEPQPAGDANAGGAGKAAGTIPADRGTETPTGTLTWPGPITVRPVSQAAELAKGDDVRVRLNGEQPGSVVITDTKSGLNGKTQALEYGATTRELVLSGPGESGVFFAAAGGQSFESDHVNVNIATGEVVTGAGRGVLNGPGLPADQAAAFQQITWNHSAKFAFEMKDGAMTSALRRAQFNGADSSRGVVATDQRSALSGDSLVAEFTRTNASPNVLSKVIVTGSAIAQGGGAGSLSTDEMTIEFTPTADGREGEPSRMIARGNVMGEREGTVLRADMLDSGLGRDSKDNIGATIVNATGNIRFDRKDGVGATARTLVADAQAQTVTLTGDLANDPASVYKDKSIITGEKIDLDGAARTLLVTGAGSFSHEQPRRKGPRGDEPATEGLGDPDMKRADATWTKGMLFNDVTGVLVCEGDVLAMTDPAGLRVDVVRGNKIRLELTPGGEGGDKKKSLEGLANAGSGNSDDRRLLRAEVFGHSYDTKGGAPAIVESSIYIAGEGTGSRVLERTYNITGDQIIADAQADTLTVPGPGKAVIVDLRKGDADSDARPIIASQPSDMSGIGKSVGTSKFEWAGSLLFDRRTGVLDLQRTVIVKHQAVDDPNVVTLDAERLMATLRSRRGVDGQPAPAAGFSGKGSAELVKVDALDSVYLESQVPGKQGSRRMVVCDRLHFNADARTAEAFASERNRLRLFDETKGTAVDAERLFWDLAADRYDIIKPTPITSPR